MSPTGLPHHFPHRASGSTANARHLALEQPGKSSREAIKWPKAERNGRVCRITYMVPWPMGNVGGAHIDWCIAEIFSTRKRDKPRWRSLQEITPHLNIPDWHVACGKVAIWNKSPLKWIKVNPLENILSKIKTYSFISIYRHIYIYLFHRHNYIFLFM